MTYETKKWDLRKAGDKMVYFENLVGDTSPRGKDRQLILRSNPLTHQKRQRVSTSGVLSLQHDVTAVNYPYYTDDVTYNKAYSSFRKKVHYGSASLGVTFGSWRQSVKMIRSRLRDATFFMEAVANGVSRRHLLRLDHYHSGDKSIKRRLADNHLEWIFGWVPLFSDISAAMAVFASEMPPSFITGQGRSYYMERFNTNNGDYYGSDEFIRRVRLTAQCAVTNPNLWVLNRLGLINPATVAWDLIPWSFVVGMFVNVNQIVNSFTDWVGLSLSNYSRTNSLVGYQDVTTRNRYLATGNNTATSRIVYREKRRVTGTSPERPSLILKCPELNLGLLTMSSALAVQQAERIAKMRGRS